MVSFIFHLQTHTVSGRDEYDDTKLNILFSDLSILRRAEIYFLKKYAGRLPQMQLNAVNRTMPEYIHVGNVAVQPLITNNNPLTQVSILFIKVIIFK